MKKKFKQLIAPSIIAVLVIIYYVVIATVLLSYRTISIYIQYILVFLPIAGIGVIIYVYIERIKEIKKGENDDLSKY